VWRSFLYTYCSTRCYIQFLSLLIIYTDWSTRWYIQIEARMHIYRLKHTLVYTDWGAYAYKQVEARMHIYRLKRVCIYTDWSTRWYIQIEARMYIYRLRRVCIYTDWSTRWYIQIEACMHIHRLRHVRIMKLRSSRYYDFKFWRCKSPVPIKGKSSAPSHHDSVSFFLLSACEHYRSRIYKQLRITLLKILFKLVSRDNLLICLLYRWNGVSKNTKNQIFVNLI
jgi:hypothetical protein